MLVLCLRGLVGERDNVKCVTGYDAYESLECFRPEWPVHVLGYRRFFEASFNKLPFVRNTTIGQLWKDSPLDPKMERLLGQCRNVYLPGALTAVIDFAADWKSLSWHVQDGWSQTWAALGPPESYEIGQDRLIQQLFAVTLPSGAGLRSGKAMCWVFSGELGRIVTNDTAVHTGMKGFHAWLTGLLNSPYRVTNVTAYAAVAYGVSSRGSRGLCWNALLDTFCVDVWRAGEAFRANAG